ncbi:hypothetical protein H311_02287 [Anncaliia algerae PRA109]|nr:hypothetical protein H311_02287 [Anncaliia algerae PRA109]
MNSSNSDFNTTTSKNNLINHNSTDLSPSFNDSNTVREFNETQDQPTSNLVNTTPISYDNTSETIENDSKYRKKISLMVENFVTNNLNAHTHIQKKILGEFKMVSKYFKKGYLHKRRTKTLLRKLLVEFVNEQYSFAINKSDNTNNVKMHKLIETFFESQIISGHKKKSRKSKEIFKNIKSINLIKLDRKTCLISNSEISFNFETLCSQFFDNVYNAILTFNNIYRIKILTDEEKQKLLEEFNKILTSSFEELGDLLTVNFLNFRDFNLNFTEETSMPLHKDLKTLIAENNLLSCSNENRIQISNALPPTNELNLVENVNLMRISSITVTILGASAFLLLLLVLLTAVICKRKNRKVKPLYQEKKSAENDDLLSES